LLKQLDRQKVEKEKVLLTALCSVLDSFHFEFEGDEEAEGMLVPLLAQSRTVMKPRGKRISVEEKLAGRMLLEEEGEGGLVMKKIKTDKDGNDPTEEQQFEEEETKEIPTSEQKNEAGTDLDKEDREEEKYGDDKDDEPEEGKEGEELSQPVNKSHTIARAVVNSVMPWVKVFLLKEEKDHKGNKSKTVRPMVALALTALIARYN
jgi:hypothetical protein